MSKCLTQANRWRPTLGLILAIGLFLGLSTSAQARTYDEIIQSGFIRIAVYEDFPPYSYEQNGQPAGVDVAIAETIADGLNIDLQILWIKPDETLEDDLRNAIWKGHMLQEKQITGRAIVADVMLRAPYDRELSLHRDEVGELKYGLVHFFGPYQQERWQSLYDSEKLDSLKTVAKFQYHPVGVEIDSLPATYLTSAMRGIMREKTVHFPNVRAAYQGMVDGEVSAIVAMRGEIDSLLSNTDSERYQLGENSYPGMAKQYWDIGMATHDDNRQLGYAVNDIIKPMVLSGAMNELYDRYGLRYNQPEYYQEITGN